jgi:autotransporter-associated beta strand protein
LTLGSYTFITAPSGLGATAFTLGTAVITVGGSIYSLSLENSTPTAQVVTIAEGGNLWTNGAGNHLWTTAGNWTDGVPSGAGVAVSFAQAFRPATPNPVQLSGTKTVGHLLLNTNTGIGYSIGAVGNTDILRLDNGANTPRVSVASGTHIINSPVELNKDATTVTLTSSASVLTMVGNITQVGGARSLTKAGAGTLTLSGTNSYTGGTNIDGGTLLLAGAGIPLATTGAVTMGGGTLDLGTQTRTVGAVSITAPAGSGDTIRNGNLTGSSYAATNTTGNAIVSATLNGTGTLTKSGAGTLTLTGTNGYTGATNVNGGTLVVLGPTSGAGPALANTLITVASGATFAAYPGSGSVTVGRTNLVSSGGRLTLNAGSAFTMVDNAIGTLNLFQGGAVLNGLTASVASGTAPTLTFELGGSLLAIDVLNVTRPVVTSNPVKGQIIIQPLTGLTSLVPGNYTFMTAGGTTPGLGPTAFTLATTSLNVNGNNYALSLANSTTTAQILTITNAFADEPGKMDQGGGESFDPFFSTGGTMDGNGLPGTGSGSAVVPEPGSLGLLLVGSLGLLASRRRASGRA